MRDRDRGGGQLGAADEAPLPRCGARSGLPKGPPRDRLRDRDVCVDALRCRLDQRLSEQGRCAERVSFANVQVRGIDLVVVGVGQASVKEYILIGHTGDGLNGDPMRTWGYRKLSYEDESEDDDDNDDEQVEGYIEESERAYVKDGFERVDLPHLSKWQLCRFDNVSSLSGQVREP